MKILIADDSKAMRMIVRRTLRLAGFGDFEVVEATDGKVALDMIHESEPDLVLSDWNMPNMMGIELLTQLRQEGIKVPFGFVTSEGTKEMRARAANAGAKFLIAKPFTEETFETQIGPLFGREPSARLRERTKATAGKAKTRTSKKKKKKKRLRTFPRFNEVGELVGSLIDKKATAVPIKAYRRPGPFSAAVDLGA